mmetsp:Transcript_27077/g.43361  ORF Transcript_27077/g.43361 Transcript_27077/m.43361 type:complete len:83 (+) Transcript_27077:1072-1320(+)
MGLLDPGVRSMIPGRLRGVVMDSRRGVAPGGVLIEKHLGVELTAPSAALLLRGVACTWQLRRSRPSPGSCGRFILPDAGSSS